MEENTGGTEGASKGGSSVGAGRCTSDGHRLRAGQTHRTKIEGLEGAILALCCFREMEGIV